MNTGKRHTMPLLLAALLLAVSDARAGTPAMLGERGNAQARASDRGPVVLFPDSRTFYLSFFLSDAGEFNDDEVAVCYRSIDDGIRLEKFDRSCRENAGSGDDCLNESNGWRRVLYTSERDASGFPLRPPGYTVSNKFISTDFDPGDRSKFPGFAIAGHLVGHYRAIIPGLEPDSLYEYRISQRSESPLAFNARFKLANRVVIRTPPQRDSGAKASRFGFAAMADLRSYDGDHMQEKVRYQLQDLARNGRADLVVLPGDISNQSGTSYQYFEAWFGFYEKLMPWLPFYPIHGNHDLFSMKRRGGWSADGHHFFTMVDLPPNAAAEAIAHAHPSGGSVRGYRSFYSFDWGDTHFIALDVPDFDSPGFNEYGAASAQYEWLNEDLEKSADSRWRVAYFHGPPGPAWGRSKAMRELMGLLKRHRVHLVVSGHWERPSLAIEDRDDVPWVVLPSGGSRARFAKNPDPCALKGRHRFGLFAFEVEPEAIAIRGVNAYGEEFLKARILRNTDGAPIGKIDFIDLTGCQER